MKNSHKLFHALLQGLALFAFLLISQPVYGAAVRDLPSAPGRLRIGLATDEKTLLLVDAPELVKTALDLGWRRAREEWNGRLIQFINQTNDYGTIKVASDLATTENAELKVMQIDNGVSLKYVLPDNKIWLTLKTAGSDWQLSYVISFDIEVLLAIQSSPHAQRLQVTDAAIRLQNTQVDGNDLTSVLMKPLFEVPFQTVQEYLEQMGSVLLPAIKELGDQFIATTLAPIPANAIYLDIGVDPTRGAIALCFKTHVKNSCVFPEL